VFLTVFFEKAKLLPGGYVGVDIFFVISGYLVGRQVMKSHEDGSFEYTGFYVKRVRRILPAVQVMLFLNIGAALFVYGGVTEGVKAVARTTLWALGWGVNVEECFFVARGYFDAESATNPLLHLWSLGVEEQFYLVWPVVLGVLARRQWRGMAMGGIVVASFAFAEGLLQHGQAKAAYYLLPARMGELALGTLVAMVGQSEWGALGAAGKTAMGLGGLGLIWSSLVLLDETTLFPGLWAVPGSVGAGLVIWAGERKGPGGVAAYLLSFKWLRFVGLASYSIYLYHWPIMAYLRLLSVSFKGLHGVAVLGLTGVCASFSFVYVENGLRGVKWRARFVFLFLFAVPAILLAGLSVAVLIAPMTTTPMTTGGRAVAGNKTNHAFLDSLFTQEEQMNPKSYWKVFHPNSPFSQRHFDGRLTSAKIFDKEKKVKKTGFDRDAEIFVIGDSHAVQLVPIVDVFSGRNLSIAVRWASGCPPFISGTSGFVFTKACTLMRESVLMELEQVARPGQLVVLASLWHHSAVGPVSNFEADLDRTLSRLRQLKVSVIIIGSGPNFPKLRRNCPMNLPERGDPTTAMCIETVKLDRNNRGGFVNELVARSAARNGAFYWSINANLCPAGICSPYYKGRLMFWHPNHYNEIMAFRFAHDVIQTFGLPAVWKAFLSPRR
jgi:peptidoglycan/LPS O-acetylase OafA/YrhL